ncbi:MFS drug efflux transporter [Nannizzia gypsea CBS 118893]|uniref:MFS drug efflux transporter n=1 Tax=Arthroderma gypseum (strain ATCC MYA-4604 / CBS 118893) TaxID=535722 RepID=E4UNB5_ARTGP|nr:MFS drug efflux transporter [Nannizzia gypsea CBS 118893]EFQ99576.1 MFS drug efflux transporter [Nannizzia gypsea CBS 118893]
MGELTGFEDPEAGACPAQVVKPTCLDFEKADEKSPISSPERDQSPSGKEVGTRSITGFKASTAPLYLWILVVTAILSSHMLFALDNTIVANIQPAIVDQFLETQKISWLSVAFPLCSSALVLPWSKAYATYNAKWLYIGCVILFMAGSALCGAAPSMNAMIVGRAIAGAGGSGMYFGVLTLLSVNTTVNERPFYIGLTAVSWGIGTVTGPAIGGAFAESAATWRWAFYINLVIGGVFAPVYLLLLPSFEPLPNSTHKEKAQNIDWVGALLCIGALATIVMAIDFGGSEWSWNSGPSIALFVVAGVLFIVFGVQQTFYILCTETNRLFPVHFLKNRSLFLLFILNTCASSGLFISVYYIPLYFQFTQGDTAIKASIRLLPFVLILIFTIIFNGHMMSRFGYYFPWYLLGSAFELIAATLMYLVKPDTSAGAIYGYTALMALGVGAFNQAGYSVVQAKVQPNEIPWALGYMMVSQLGGIVLALGIAGAIFVNKATTGLLSLLPDADPEVVKNAIAGTSSSFFKSLSDYDQARALGVIVSAIDQVYILLIVAGAMGVVLSAFLNREKLFLEVAAGGA